MFGLNYITVPQNYTNIGLGYIVIERYSWVVYPGESENNAYVWNINSLLYLRKSWNGCMRVRESERVGKELQGFTRHWDRYIESYFFGLLSRETDAGKLLNSGATWPPWGNAQNGWLTAPSADWLTAGVENFRHYIYFLTPSCFFLRNLRGISAVPCLP